MTKVIFTKKRPTHYDREKDFVVFTPETHEEVGDYTKIHARKSGKLSDETDLILIPLHVYDWLKENLRKDMYPYEDE